MKTKKEDVKLKAGGGPIVLRAGGGPIVVRYTGDAGPEFVADKRVVCMGWQPDIPDRRDFTVGSKKAQEIFKRSKSRLAGLNSKGKGSKLPSTIDNSDFCSEIENQGTLGSCTAHAVIGMMEYMMRRSEIAHINLARLFLYKVTRNLLGWNGDTGAYIRSTIQATAVFGVPPEKHYPYLIEKFEEEPSAFLYSYASNFQALNYTRLDEYGQTGMETLERVKQVLAAGYVAAFGFPVYSSLSNSPNIPYPKDHDSLEGGHAVLVVGYDDNHKVGNKNVPSLIIRNSWGENWGDNGYGYLPYKYVEDDLAQDFWTIFKEEWIHPNRFA